MKVAWLEQPADLTALLLVGNVNVLQDRAYRTGNMMVYHVPFLRRPEIADIAVAFSHPTYPMLLFHLFSVFRHCFAGATEAVEGLCQDANGKNA